MKPLVTILITAVVAFMPSCSRAPLYQNPSASPESRASDLLKRMTLEEKILQASQYYVGENDNPNNKGAALPDLPAETGSLIFMSKDPAFANALQRKAVEESRLGIPVLLGYDVIHGYRTIFPIPLAQACSWNPDMAEKCARIAASEAVHAGLKWTFSPMVDIARDPRWGRVMEGYGEDPFTASVFAAALVRGYQGDDLSDETSLASCLKHYVGYGASEAGRDYVPTDMSDQTLWDTYLPSFKSGVEAGASTVMSAFNTLNGIPASANHYTLTEILKEKWDFDGFVVSDWGAVDQLVYQGMAADKEDAAALAINAGVDMDMSDWVYRDYLASAINDGTVSMKILDEAVMRILTLKFKLGLFENPYVEELPESEWALTEENLDASLKMAEESIVLLKNNGVLPLDKDAKVALTGPFADSRRDMNGAWSAMGNTFESVSIAQAMSPVFTNLVSSVATSDVVVCCIGQGAGWTGENRSVSSLEIAPEQEDLVKQAKNAGKKVVVVLTNGRPLVLSSIEPYADAIVETWHLGTRAGDAIAAVLCGYVNPSGKLAITFPYSMGQIPIYYNRHRRARLAPEGNYIDGTIEPLYTFGYGLSYSTFEYANLKLSSAHVRKGEIVTASVDVTNTSSIDGAETVFWFIRDVASLVTRPDKELRHFEKLVIPAGETRTFCFEIEPLRDLGTVDAKGDRYVDAGEYTIMVGSSSVSLNVE